MSINTANRARQRTRKALLEAGIHLILERGYDGVTVSDIVRAADYGRSTFYLHFKDKEDLVWTLLKNQTDQLDALVWEAVSQLESPLKEHRAWNIIFSTIEMQREFFAMLDSDLSRILRQRQKAYTIANFEAHYRSGRFSLFIGDVPPEIQARFVVGALLEVLDYWIDHPDSATPEQLKDQFLRLLYRGDDAP